MVTINDIFKDGFRPDLKKKLECLDDSDCVGESETAKTCIIPVNDCKDIVPYLPEMYTKQRGGNKDSRITN